MLVIVGDCLPSAAGPCVRFLCRLQDNRAIAVGGRLKFASQQVVPC